MPQGHDRPPVAVATRSGPTRPDRPPPHARRAPPTILPARNRDRRSPHRRPAGGYRQVGRAPDARAGAPTQRTSTAWTKRSQFLVVGPNAFRPAPTPPPPRRPHEQSGGRRASGPTV